MISISYHKKRSLNIIVVCKSKKILLWWVMIFANSEIHLPNEWMNSFTMGKKYLHLIKHKIKKVNGRNCCKSKMILLWVIIFAHQKFISLMNEFIHDHGKDFWFASHKRSGIIIKYSFKMCSNYCNYHRPPCKILTTIFQKK